MPAPAHSRRWRQSTAISRPLRADCRRSSTTSRGRRFSPSSCARKAEGPSHASSSETSTPASHLDFTRRRRYEKYAKRSRWSGDCSELRVGCAAAARGLSRGAEGVVLPKGNGQVRSLQRRRVEPGTFKDASCCRRTRTCSSRASIAGTRSADKAYSSSAESTSQARWSSGPEEAEGGSSCAARPVGLRGAGAYLRRETALLAVEGKRGKHPGNAVTAVQGLYKGPPLIKKVETLMNAPCPRMGGRSNGDRTEPPRGRRCVDIGLRRAPAIRDRLQASARDIRPRGGKLAESGSRLIPGGSSAPCSRHRRDARPPL